MNFTPKQLILFILEKLAYSGNVGLSVNELWDLCATKLPNVDAYMKSIIWNWLFNDTLSKDKLLLWSENKQVHVIKDYQEFLSSIADINNLRIFPTLQTQWEYLVDKDVSEQTKASIGNFPFELLVEIAKHGSKGILASELSKATGQDPRSSTPRLKKLEELNLIVRNNFYDKDAKQHTSICIHINFASEVYSSVVSLQHDDFNITRNGQKLRSIIMEKVKQAPNQLRSLVDLRDELKLNNDFSAHRFFKAIIKSLCSKGYLSKIMAKQDEEKSAIVCVRYEKDLSGDDKIDDLLEMFDNLKDNEEDREDEQGDEQKYGTHIPSYSSLFPVTNQIYEKINSCSDGMSSMDISKVLTGMSDYRPIIRLLDIITSTVSENGKVKSLKKRNDFYIGCQISRSYDFEGKFKFYRYFGAGIVTASDVSKVGPKSGNLAEMNKKYQVSIGKLMSGTLFNDKKRKAIEDVKTVKVPRTRKLQDVKTSLDTNDMHDESMSVEDFNFKKDSETDKEFDGDIEGKPKRKERILPFKFQVEEKEPATAKNLEVVSLKAIKRRDALVEIIKLEGGVVFTSADLRRKLDQSLGNTYVTDRKTLSRDIASLIRDGILESQDINTIKSGQPITRKLLILIDPRPSDEKIEEIRYQGEVLTGIEKVVYRNYYNDLPVASDNVTIFVPKTTKRLSKLSDNKHETKSITKRINIKQEGKDKLEKENSGMIIEDVDISESEKPVQGFESLVNANITVRRSSKRKRVETPSNGRKSRVLRLSEKDLTKMYRMFIITRTFKRGIDYERLSTYFGSFSVRDMQQKWANLRKARGGLEGVSKNIYRFEKIVLKAVEQGKVEQKHLDPIDYDFFIQLWENLDIKTSKLQKRLYFELSANYDEYHVSITHENPTVLADQLYLNSMVQKEEILAHNPFFCKNNEQLNMNEEEDKIKTSLRSLANENNFSKPILEKVFGLEQAMLVTKVVERMVSDREATLFENVFKLTERFHNSFVPSKIINQFHQCYKFFENMASVVSNSLVSGILLSQGISDSHMMAILNLISSFDISTFHIDNPYKFDSYESRLIDKTKLNCEIIIQNNSMNMKLFKHVPVPTGKISSHIWFRSDASIDTDIWTSIVVSLIWYISFHPGIPKYLLYYKFKSSLTMFDLNSVLKWLYTSGYIIKGNYDDYFVNSQWYTIVG